MLHVLRHAACAHALRCSCLLHLLSTPFLLPPKQHILSHLLHVYREQSLEYGTKIYTETVNTVELQHGSPFTLHTDTKVVQTDALIIATGAAAKRLKIPGADEETGFWNKGISACAVCDGSSPLFRWGWWSTSSVGLCQLVLSSCMGGCVVD